MGAESPVCRLCGSTSTEDRGGIPDSDYFAGQVLSRALPGGRLWRCASCGSMFRHPILTSHEYWLLYQSTPPLHWAGGDRREDMRVVRSIVVDAPTHSVLDVGCGSGDFLASLPDGIAKCGIEPSPAAAVARQRGIEIVAPLLETAYARCFDAVTLIDVIEHAPDPNVLLDQAYARVSPGGLLIIATGDPEAPLWRAAFRGRFWYVSYPEHISFPSFLFFQQWCARADAVLTHRRRTPHQRLNPLQRSVGLALQSAFLISPRAFSWALGLLKSTGATGKPTRRTFSPDVPGTFVDHQIIVIAKPTRFKA